MNNSFLTSIIGIIILFTSQLALHYIFCIPICDMVWYCLKVLKLSMLCCLRYCKLQSVENTFELVLPLLWEACMARCFYMYDCVRLQVWWCVSVSMALYVVKYDELLPLCRFKYEQGVQVGTLFVLLKPFKRLISKTKYAKLLVFCPSSPPINYSFPQMFPFNCISDSLLWF